ncbi:MAG: dihydrofolate reductase [Candidatus Aminicenantes bacterium]|nr:dihydrofolate reductase [Candidatus Aminicenantes bacterium]
MRLSIIAAMARNRVIGRDNRLPWRLPADWRRIKRLTMSHHLIMGRKTFESIGRPLPGRISIVLTGRRSYAAAGVQVAASLEDALRLAQGDKEVFVGGGAGVYRQTLDLADRMYLTLLPDDFEGDTYFPRYDESHWEVRRTEVHEPEKTDPNRYTFLTLDRLRDRSFRRT